MIPGMTCTVYTVCAAIAGQGLPYSLSNLDAAGAAATAKGLVDFACSEDFIEISGSSEVCGSSVLTNKYCGDVLTTETATAATLNNPICGKFSCFCLPKKSSTKGKFFVQYTRLNNPHPKFYHSYFHCYFYQNTSVCMH